MPIHAYGVAEDKILATDDSAAFASLFRLLAILSSFDFSRLIHTINSIRSRPLVLRAFGKSREALRRSRGRAELAHDHSECIKCYHLKLLGALASAQALNSRMPRRNLAPFRNFWRGHKVRQQRRQSSDEFPTERHP